MQWIIDPSVKGEQSTNRAPNPGTPRARILDCGLASQLSLRSRKGKDMAADNYPVIVGVGQYVNRSLSLDDSREPADMMALVARAAEADTGVEGLLARVDSVQVVNIIGWSYPDAPGLLPQRLGARPEHTLYSSIGGETPQRLINETAQAIAEGRTRVALLAGAEALHP